MFSVESCVRFTFSIFLLLSSQPQHAACVQLFLSLCIMVCVLSFVAFVAFLSSVFHCVFLSFSLNGFFPFCICSPLLQTNILIYTHTCLLSVSCLVPVNHCAELTPVEAACWPKPWIQRFLAPVKPDKHKQQAGSS